MKEIYDLINSSNKILLLTHENPDGDAIGSVLALYNVLINLNKDVQMIIPEYPYTFDFLDAIKYVKKSSSDKYDLGIVLDCSSKERIGQTNQEFDNCEKTIIIDHHKSNTNYGNVNYVKGNVPACCQVIYYLLKDLKINIDKKIGEYLTVGLITDTGGFVNDNVDKNSFLMIADMIDLNVDIHNLFYLTLLKKTMAQHQLMKMVMDRIEFYNDGKIAFSYISRDDMANVGAKKGDHEGLVDIARNISGVEVSILIREDDGYYVSFRANGNIDVSEIAKRLGGGGHKSAAGTKINLNFLETKELLISETKKEFL